MTIQTEKLKLLDEENTLKIHIKQEGICVLKDIVFLSINHSIPLCIYLFIPLNYTCHRNYFT